ncbi:hypothetical protein BDN72DRAFT_850325 [Pluteus cervinus]|uniref:Uncharacterized protein n=1 Tax=Pluteus cervinus TaxID=181527 RepID=A0ACD3A4S8_9AGAR|nr:hypothetical protein BDN72DRAFT_850325 [Pluteus cervinus]
MINPPPPADTTEFDEGTCCYGLFCEFDNRHFIVYAYGFFLNITFVLTSAYHEDPGDAISDSGTPTLLPAPRSDCCSGGRRRSVL